MAEFLKRIVGRSRSLGRRGPSKAPAPRRLALEALETRELLSAVPGSLRAWVDRDVPGVAQAACVIEGAGLPGPPSLAVVAPGQTCSAEANSSSPAVGSSAQSGSSPAASASSVASLQSQLAVRGAARIVVSYSKTFSFIRNIDLARYIRVGTDFTNPDYTPEGIARRVGKPFSEIDPVYDYDFAKLKAVEQRLSGVSRSLALQAIFRKITAGARTPTEKHLNVVKFLQQAMYHNPYIQPMYPDGAPVTDPLVLLELGEMRCGQVARLAVDLFAAGGYRGRLVQLGAHTIAEVYYNRGWHYVDVDLFGNGETVRNADGSIPSVAELSQVPQRIDALGAYWEPNYKNDVPLGGSYYPAYFYFSRSLWDAQEAGRGPYVVRKTASYYQQRTSKYYGWERMAMEPYPGRQLYDLQLLSTPGAPSIRQIELAGAADGSLRVSLAWDASRDRDGDLLGYRVFVSRDSRGWNYDGQSLPEDLMGFKSHSAGWNPAMYAARFTLPRSEVALVDTASTSVELALGGVGDYYVTVMPYDAHGVLAGRQLYPMSEEIVLRNPAPALAIRTAGGAGRSS